MPTTAPYGTWTSPITSELIAVGSVTFKEVHTKPRIEPSNPKLGHHPTQQDGGIFLIEGRPSENGRSTILQISKDGASNEILPAQFNSGSKVYGYGGGAATMTSTGQFVFNDVNTDGVYTLNTSDGAVTPLVGGNKRFHYADFNTFGKWTLAVREEHFEDGTEAKSEIVALQNSGEVLVVVEGADFYSHPRFSPDGRRVSWMQWNHPDMPWTGSELQVADWRDGGKLAGKFIAGKAREQAVCQPRWAWNGDLWFVNEPKGIWNLFKYDVKEDVVEEIILKGYQTVEVGAREVHLGNTTYIQLSADKLVITYCRNSVNGLIAYDIPSKTVTELPLGLVHIEFAGLARVSDIEFAVIGSEATSPQGLYLVDITKPSEKKLLKSSSDVDIPQDVFSPAKSISYPRTHGIPGTAYGIFSPPQNSDFQGIAGTKPPLIVSVHGGPTSNDTPKLMLEAQYFTSRGYAYVHINHTGSIGFDRAYRMGLNYNWGIRDVEDTLSCIDYLADSDVIDRTKVGIRGGSAGGYSVLQSLVTHPKVFAAGCSLYGVGDLKDLASKTHKFESHYLWDLLFPADTPEEEKERIMFERSPAFHADKIESPLILQQGDKDSVVPMVQSVGMEKVLKEAGKDVELVIFEGEGHGWEGAKAIKEGIEGEEKLWRRTLVVA